MKKGKEKRDMGWGEGVLKPSGIPIVARMARRRND
jgi:hypothetical protein